MKRCKNCALLVFLLVLFVLSPASCQEKTSADEDSIDLTPPEDAAAEKTEDDRGAGQIVGQSLIPPLLGQSLMPPLNLFSGVFPALNSLLLWSNMFPMSTLLGQPLLGQPQQAAGALTQLGDLVPSPSKVVLVLAEDRNPHAAMKAANQEAARTIRQNDMLSQLLAQISQADLGQMLSQSFDPLQQQNPGQLLQQMMPADLSQSMNQMLSQVLQPLPGLDLSQVPLLGQMLGQAAPAAEPTVGQAADAAGDGADAAVAGATDAAASSAQQLNMFPNFQSAIDAGTQLLGQALQQNPDMNSVFQFPNIQQAFDASSQMLGQAFQQSNDPSSGGFSLPNIQSMIDSGTQMLSQSGGLFNMRPTQSLEPATSASDAEPAASDISEVRVKPDAIPITMQQARQTQMPATSHTPSAFQMPTPQSMDELNMMTALHKALAQKKLPVLWFRAPADPTLKDREFDMKPNTNTKPKNVEELQMEAKLQVFQHQVIKELRLLQEIERQAKEMRAASKGVSAKTFKDATSPYTNTLSKIPVHKITHADIEKALKDEYVRKLLQKTAIGQMKERMAYQPESTHMKRQAMQSSMTPRQMSREDIIRLLAYAYRIANANGLRGFETAGSIKPMKENGGNMRANVKEHTESMMHKGGKKWANDAMKQTQESTKPMERQMMHGGKHWMNDEPMPAQTPKTSEEHIMPASRQMLAKMRETMARQWTTGPNAPKPTTTDAARQSMEQQMPMPYTQGSQQQSPHMMPQNRQMTDNMQASPQMPMEPQLQQQPQQFDTQSEGMPRQNMPASSCAVPMPTAEGRQWAEQQSQKAMQEAQKMMQQEQAQTRHQEQQPVGMEQQTKMDMQQSQKTMPETTQIDMQQARSQDMQEKTTDMQQSTADKQEMTPNMHGPLLVGEATPQMPENTGKARKKDDFYDGWGGGWGGWGGGWGGWGGDGWGGGWGDGFGGGWGILPGWGGGWGGPGWGGPGWGGGWGGWDDSKKGGKHGSKYGGWPTVVNYYYNPGGHHRDGHDHTITSDHNAGSSYSNSKSNYGSTNYNYGSSNYASPNTGSTASYTSGYKVPSGAAYRTAVGDDEIQEMLEEHAREKMITTEHERNPTTTTACEQVTIPQQDTTTTSLGESSDHSNEELADKEATKTTIKSTTDTKTTTKTTKIDAPSKQYNTAQLSSRLDCKLRLNDILDVGKLLKKTKCLRPKRSVVDYNTLQPIDEASLKELRKTYKDSLKEITLQPDEDPTEALMRYNAASIREALEHANEEPMEVHAADTHCEHEVTILDQHEQARSRLGNEPNMYKHDEQHPNTALSQYSVQQRKDEVNEKQHEPAKYESDRKETLSTAIDPTHIEASSKANASDEARSIISNLRERELQAVIELIKQQIQECCDACRDRILSSIKTNIQNANESETTTQMPAPKTKPLDDLEFAKWVREMELKGYDSKYLTKSHYWEYLNSGKLALTVESDEDVATQAQSDNKIGKKSLESSQTFKRYTQNPAPLKAVDSKAQYKKVDRTKGKAFDKNTPVLNPNDIRDDAHVVNDELEHLKVFRADAEEHTPSPYALRGKFKHSNKRNTGVTTPISAPVKFNAMALESPKSKNNSNSNNNVDTNNGKVVELLSLLYDLNPTVTTENGKPAQLSVMVMPFVETTTAQTEQANLTDTTSRTRKKRLRLRRKKLETSTEQATPI